MAGAKQVENRVDELEKRLEAMQAEFQKWDMEKLQNDIPFLKESVVAILTKIDSYSPETTAQSMPAIENSQQHPNQSGAMLESLPRRLELPVFEGENPEGWLFRAERYFELNNMSSAEKLRSAVVCLEGDALSWYYYEEGRRPFRSWEEFKLQLLERFQLTQAGIDKISSLGETILIVVKKLDAFAKRLDEMTQQQPPILEVLEQTPADSAIGNSKEQETCLFDASSPPSASMDSLLRRLDTIMSEGVKVESWSLEAESYFELSNLSSPTKRVWSVVVCLKNDFLFFYNCGECQRPSCKWEDCRKILVERQGFWKKKRKKKKKILMEQFSYLNLEDKVQVWAGSNVRNHNKHNKY